MTCAVLHRFGVHGLDGIPGGLDDFLDLRLVRLFGGDELGLVRGVVGNGVLGGEGFGERLIDVLFAHVAHHALNGDGGFVHGFFLLIPDK